MQHVTFVETEHLSYCKKKDSTRLDPGRFCSIIVDGAGQSAFGLSRIVSKTKDDREPCIEG